MRLLKVEPDGTFSLIRANAKKIPRYAILSHTWEADDQEVTFQDFVDGLGERKAGYRKIRFCGEQASLDGIQYIWVDSCCIDKSSSAELAEAINSMFKWYRNADRCYVYLSDVPTANVDLQTFRRSRWFTRGWTLQELLAPRTVEFFSQDGQKIGDKQSLELQIHQVSGIPIRALQQLGDLSQFSVKERMSWTARRETTVEEDQAYCLLGIFEVYLPLIYGEGREHALGRLRDEINKKLAVSCPTIGVLNVFHDEANLVFKKQDASSIIEKLPATNNHECLASLVPTDQTRFLSQALVRSKDSCAWIFQNQKYISWYASKSSSLLWIAAKAGHGKTTLATHICQKISSRQHVEPYSLQKDEPKCIVLYFFFQKTNDAAVKTASAAFRTLVHQLVSQIPAVLPNLQKRYDSLSTMGKVDWCWDALSAMLNEMLEQISQNTRVYIILDALDECELESRMLILDWAKELVDEQLAQMDFQGLRTNLRILVTSRPDGDIIDHLSDYPTLEITESDTTNDIQTLIRNRVEKFAHQRRLKPDVTKHITDFLDINAHGMFLWVVLIMQELERRDERLTDDVIALKLSRIPLTLYDTYISVIHNTPAARRRDMWTIYRWLLFGTSTLTLAELEAAMCLETGVSTWHDFAGDLSFLCGSLIRVGGPQEEVSFVHQTARGFLDTFIMNASAADLGEVEMGIHAANDHLAAICVQYLLLQDELLSEPDRYTYDEKQIFVQDCFERHTFLRYAVNSWAIHARTVRAPSAKLAAMIRTFLSSSIRRDGIIDFVESLQDGFLTSDDSSPLHVAAYFNVPWLMQMYISEDRKSVNPTNLNNDTPLTLAAQMGSTDIVRILLEAGADPNNRDDYYGWSALHWSAIEGHVGIVTLLLDYGANLDERDKDGETALDMAIFTEEWNVVDVLVQRAEKAGMDVKDLLLPERYKIWRRHAEYCTVLGRN